MYPTYVGDSLDKKKDPTKLDKKTFESKEQQLKVKKGFYGKCVAFREFSFSFFLIEKSNAAKAGGSNQPSSEYDEEENHEWSVSSDARESEDDPPIPKKRVRKNRLSKAGELLQMYKETELARTAEKKAEATARDARHQQKTAKSDALRSFDSPCCC